MLKKLMFLVCLILSSLSAFAQVDTAWVRRYNGPGNANDHASAIAIDNSGNVYVTGYGDGTGTYEDYVTIKYYSNGDTAWLRRYNGPGNDIDYAFAIAVDGSGNVYVTGESNGSGTSTDYCTIKYYPNGDTAWLRRYNGPANAADAAYAIAVDGSGNVYVTGSIDQTGTTCDYGTIKYYSNGDIAWVKSYTGTMCNIYGWDYARSIAVDDSGNVYVTGESLGGCAVSMDYATIKYYSNGNIAWVRRYNGPGTFDDFALSMALDDSGNVYVTGASVGSSTSQDYATIKYNSSGDTVWIRRYNGPGNFLDRARSIAVNGSGNVYVTGTSYRDANNEDYVTIKYNSSGDTVWVRRYNGPGNDDDCAWDLALDDFGNAYVTGWSYGSGTYEDYATIKYYSNGDTAWVRRYDGSGIGLDVARAVAVDASGNVYVTGESTVDGGYIPDYATIKYWQNTAPNSFSLLSPIDSAGTSILVTFDWQDAVDPDPCDTIRYDLYLSTSPAFQVDSTAIFDSLLTSTSIDTLDSGRYYWKVKAYDKRAAIWSTQSWSFTVWKQLSDTLKIFAYSPVDLIVTAPNIDSIGVSFNTIPSATYDTTTDRNSDGDSDDIVTIPKPLVGDYLIRVVAEPGADTGHYTLGIKMIGGTETIVVTNAEVPLPGQPDTFVYEVMELLRGDANADGKVTVSDVVYLINYLFKGGPAPIPWEAGEANCDGKVTVSDVVYLINYLFKGGPAPCG